MTAPAGMAGSVQPVGRDALASSASTVRSTVERSSSRATPGVLEFGLAAPITCCSLPTCRAGVSWCTSFSALAASPIISPAELAEAAAAVFTTS
jgi:hypothetical protein